MYLIGNRRGSRNFSRGGGEEENVERKMFVDTRINACTHKTRQTRNSFSLFSFQEDCQAPFNQERSKLKKNTRLIQIKDIYVVAIL